MTTTRASDEPATQAPAPPREHPSGPAGGDAAAPEPARAAGPAAEPLTAGLPQLARLLGTIAAPTTLLTSLLFYFGWSHAFYFFDVFGVNSTLFGLTTRDYLQRSLDALFVPMTVVACVGLLLLWGHGALRNRLAAGAEPRVLRVLLPVAAVGGLALAVGGVSSVFVMTELREHLALAPISLAVGVLLLVYAVHLWRYLTAVRQGPGRVRGSQGAAVAEWAAVFVLVGLSLFWIANDYSAAVGRERARRVVAKLPTYPTAVLYSERSLSLGAPGVREVRCRDPEAAYRFRYDGLKLVLQAGDQYLFLPESWRPRDGVAILLPRSDALRLEFVPASASGALPRPTC